MVSTENLHVHLQTFLQKTQGVLVVSGLHVALAQERKNLRVVLLGLFVLLEQRAIELQSGGQVVESLLVVLVIQVCFTELSVCPHEYEEIFTMNVDQDLTNRKLFNPHLYLTVKVLAHTELIQFLVFLN